MPGVFGLGWLAARAASGAVRSVSGGRPQPGGVSPGSEAGRRSGVIGIVLFALLAGPMCAVIVQGYHGHVTLRACAYYCFAFWALLAAALVVSVLAKGVAGRAVVSRYAAPPEPDRTAARYRDLAERLRRQELLDGSRGPVLQEQALASERERRVADLFSVLCPVRKCRASAGVSCQVLVAGKPVVVAAESPLLWCHWDRVRFAVKYGTARAGEVYAQFDNSMPTGLTL